MKNDPLAPASDGSDETTKCRVNLPNVLGLEPRLRHQQHRVTSHKARRSAHAPARAPIMVMGCGMLTEFEDDWPPVLVGDAVLVLDAVVNVETGVGSGGENTSR